MATTAKHREAFKKAMEELEQAQVDEIKVLVKDALQAMQVAQRDRQRAVERIQLIKRDLDDLKAGRVAAIKDRHAKAKEADTQSPVTPTRLDKILMPQAPKDYKTMLADYQVARAMQMVSPTYTNISYAGGTSTNTMGALGMSNMLGDAGNLSQQHQNLGLNANANLCQAVTGTYVLDDGSVKHL